MNSLERNQKNVEETRSYPLGLLVETLVPFVDVVDVFLLHMAVSLLDSGRRPVNTT